MGISKLYPPQGEALDHVYQGKNLVLSVPTASGKSLVAYLAILRGLAQGGKGLYIVPLRALASEKFDDLKEILPKGYSVVMSTGDFDESDKSIMRHDVIVATSEKADSLFRHRPGFLKEFSVVVADEVHLITDPGRGHILEVLLTRLRQLSPETQLLALSATIPNSQELADWLEAVHLKSEWRPVTLKEGVFQGGVLHFQDPEDEMNAENSPSAPRKIGRGDPVGTLVKDGLRDGGQSLVFVNTRRSAEVEAKRLISSLEHNTDAEKLLEISNLLLSTQDEPTDIITRLSRCVEGGCGFHHAGLGNTQRKIMEKAFKLGHIKALVATPTLAAGINLPARRVVIRDLTRFGGRNTGNQPIANLELKQMAGRAGRPGYDPFGEAIFITRKPEDVSRIFRDVIHGKTERIESKLGVAPILRIHIISSIASGFVASYSELMTFLSGTLYAHQFGIREAEVREAIAFLQENGMILTPSPHGSSNISNASTTSNTSDTSDIFDSSDTSDTFNTSNISNTSDTSNTSDFVTADRIQGPMNDAELRTTPFGKLISDLYIDPKSAVIMKRALENSPGKLATPLSYLHAICAAPDMLTLYAREGEMGDLLMMAEHYADELFLSPMDTVVYGRNQGLAHELYAEELKTALLLKRWIDEVDENTITRSFNIGPGDLRNRVDSAQWLLHALERIASLFHFEHQELKKILRRIVYGVKEELLPLVDLKGIGRVRARILYNGGYTDVGRLKKAKVEDLLAMEGIGKASIFSIMEQIGRDMSEYVEADQEIKRLQRSLLDFGL